MAHRITIGALIALVAATALVLAAWRADSFPPSILVVLASVASLQFAVLRAAIGPQRARPFWLGFALAGLPYLVASQALAFSVWLPTNDWIASFDEVVTPAADDDSISAIVAQAPNWPSDRRLAIKINRSGQAELTWNGLSDAHRSIGQSVLTALVSILGGLAGLGLAASGRRPTARTAEMS